MIQSRANFSTWRVVLGVLVLAFLAVPLFAIRYGDGKRSTLLSPFKLWWEYQISSERRIKVAPETEVQVEIGEPVFGMIDGGWKLVGSVVEASDSSSEQEVWINWTAKGYRPIDDADWRHSQTPQSLSWVVETLLPETKRRQLTQSLFERYEAHQTQLTHELEPVVVATFRDVMPIVQNRLKESLREHRPQLEELGLKYQSEFVQERFLPIIRSEILPILQDRMNPLLSEMGAELFERASVWRFSWRYLYDLSPLPQRDLVRNEFQRFVSADAIPVFESHIEEILESLQEVAKETVKNGKVRQTVRETSAELFHDPQLREILFQSARDVFEERETLQAALRKNWESEAGMRFASTLQRVVEPWFQEVGAELLGTPNEGLTPELIAILRSQILAKDRAWIEVEIESTRTPFVVPEKGYRLRKGTGRQRFPLLLEAAPSPN